MPGLYTEPKSRAAPTHDPACASLRDQRPGRDRGALLQYQVHCPNDQNLIAVIGRAADRTRPPAAAARWTATASPTPVPASAATCRSRAPGVSPDDVTIDGGDPALGDGAAGATRRLRQGRRHPRRPRRRLRPRQRQGPPRQRARRLRRSRPTASTSTDFKTAYAGEYGVLTFVADHSLIENCDAWGNGDSGLYPGAAADLGTPSAAASGATATRSATATCTTTRSATRGPTATPSGSTTTTSTTTRRASRPTSSPRRGTPASRRTPT